MGGETQHHMVRLNCWIVPTGHAAKGNPLAHVLGSRKGHEQASRSDDRFVHVAIVPPSLATAELKILNPWLTRPCLQNGPWLVALGRHHNLPFKSPCSLKIP